MQFDESATMRILAILTATCNNGRRRNETDGSTIWKFDTAVNTSQQSEFFSTPAIAHSSVGDDLVIAGTGAGTVYAFSVVDGSLVWSFKTDRVVIGMDGGTGRGAFTHLSDSLHLSARCSKSSL